MMVSYLGVLNLAVVQESIVSMLFDNLDILSKYSISLCCLVHSQLQLFLYSFWDSKIQYTIIQGRKYTIKS